MDLGEFLLTLRRRWYVLVPLLALTGAATVMFWIRVPDVYEAHGALLLLSSQEASRDAGGNPFLAFDDSLGVTADVVSRSVMSETTAAELRATRGVTEEYDVALDPESSGPLVKITVTGGVPAHVRASTAAVMEAVTARLDTIQGQTGAPQGSRIRSTQVTPVQTPAPVLKRKLRVVLPVALAGLLGPVLFAVVLDALLVRRRVRRTAPRAADTVPVAPVPSVAPVPAAAPVPSPTSARPPAGVAEATGVAETTGERLGSELRNGVGDGPRVPSARS